ncbi:MAG TPA: DUF4153 domain-containing protein, partial [Bacteroidia bacterium]|nr:DUF4153 domain-containing protein [Bacteroidia bacterium]
ERFTEKINVDFISIEWLLFTLGGFFIICGYFRHRRIKVVDNWENNLPDSLYNKVFNQAKWNEKTAAIILFILLNIMMAFINTLDINYLYLGAGMPKGLTHKIFVHNGVGMLMLSIVLGISIILYFFRGELNFDDKNKFVKYLIYIWLLQNMMMVISTAIRNNMYVEDALLTYKRIGVYYWLFMAALGLGSTYVKLWKTKSNWFLFKSNSFMAYLVLVASAGIDWDKFIGDFNISNIKNIASLDKRYLISLSETNLARLYTIKDKAGFDVDSVYHYQYGYNSFSNSANLDSKLYDYLQNNCKDDWRLFSFRKQRVLEELNDLNSNEKIRSLDYTEKYLTTLKPLFSINNLKELNLKNCGLWHLSELGNFQKLETLNLSYNHLDSLDSIPIFKKLTYLSLANNNINEVASLKKQVSLKQLDLSDNNINSIEDLSKLVELQELSLSNNPISDFNCLVALPKLNRLSINYLTIAIEQMPDLNSLKCLSFNNSSRIVSASFANFKSIPNLDSLSIQNNQLSNFNFLLTLDAKGKALEAKYKKITCLNLSNNKVSYLSGINFLTDLKTLDAGNNVLCNADDLMKLKKLEKLDLSNNILYKIPFLDSLENLTELYLQQNAYIYDFTPLKRLNKLKVLNLSGTPFNNLTLLSCSNSLQELTLTNCLIKSFSGIERLKKVEILSIPRFKEKDLIYIQQLKQLKILRIAYSNNNYRKKLQELLPNTKIIIEG